MANVDPTVGPPAGSRSLSAVGAEAHTGYSNSTSFAIFTLTHIYPCITVAAVMFLFVLGFYNVYRIALSQNKQLGSVTNMAVFPPCK